MGRYREITSLTIAKLPNALRTPVVGSAVVYVLICAAAASIIAAGAGAAVGVGLLRGVPVEEAVMGGVWGGIGAATATLVALLLIPFIRDGLGLAEDIRLLEVASPAHPLMKELITRAPGTYTHSVATANLAEAAAERVGADPLLARVGSYYHDIGKIRRPVYFFENQQSGFNPHDEARPLLSAVIITSHVADGIELARKYRLPAKVTSVISQHHGTSLVRYFYNKAAALDAGVFEADFRYQGEKPSSKEAALVMLADSCEAAVRALRQPTEERVSAVVRSVVEEKLTDGQLDEAMLAVGDIESVVLTYSGMLTSMYHARCEYPPAPEATRSPADADKHREPSHT